MGTFYDDWLGLWEQANRERAQARTSIHEEDLAWVPTVQDHRIALLIAPETGFRTWGTETMVAEIPAGCHTGKHKHGEEAIHIVRGSGFSIVNGVRYTWRSGSTLLIPFGAEHQHFNTGDETARYFSAMCVHLEQLCGLHRTTQLAERGETRDPPAVPTSPNGFDERGRRIHLPIEDAPVRTAAEGAAPVTIEAGVPLVIGGHETMMEMGNVHKSKLTDFMRITKPTNGFQPYATEISGLLTDAPCEEGGTHAHMEAHLYILDGIGRTIIEGETVAWKPGTALHVQGPQTVHQHINDGDTETHMIRVAFGIRYFFEKMAKDEFPYLYFSFRQGYRPGSAEQERERERTR